ncbi:hypothetical protein KP79_PYT01472 [Mizuhopecten yessoensis]|uniref:Uncharacterized protein n=1 Tax=Mizuhopecten yessoensis TaxID=6573 RepID=A0A210QBD5_MIZYE|nr:hypothetical protein KP79_PYT01472 [Mizuhopecten yessoensis]
MKTVFLYAAAVCVVVFLSIVSVTGENCTVDANECSHLVCGTGSVVSCTDNLCTCKHLDLNCDHTSDCHVHTSADVCSTDRWHCGRDHICHCRNFGK